MEHQFKDSGAKAIVILANFAYNLEKIIAHTQIQHVVVTEMGDLHGFPKKQLINFVVKTVKKLVPSFHLPGAVGFNQALAKGSRETLKEVEIKSSDVAYLQYTGGTTGVSKGAMLSHRNIIANAEMIKANEDIAYDTTQPSIIVTPLPLYHVFSLTCNCMAALRSGGTVLLIPNPRDIKGFLKELTKYKFQVITGL